MLDLKHIAFIMDGNSSWSKANGFSKIDGYLKGMRTMCDVIVAASELDIKYVTFYAFSSENWKRPLGWITDFMNLARYFFKNDESIKKVLAVNARIKIIGDRKKLDSDIQELLKNYEDKTKNNDGIIVQVAISYGGRDEIVRACKKIVSQSLDFSEESISANLDTCDIPDPDLLIRTSNQLRLSNFLLWQLSYSEFYFSKLFWPEFNKEELQNAITEFYNRTRTYGK